MMEPMVLEFGIKREDEERRDGGFGIIFDPDTREYAVGKDLLDGHLRLFGGGVPAEEDIQEGILREIEEESGLYNFSRIENLGKVSAHFHNRNKSVNRIADVTCLLLVIKDRSAKPLRHETHENFFLDWTTLEEIIRELTSYNTSKDYDHWLYFLERAAKRLKELGMLR